MAMPLNGRVAVITGAGGGLGREHALYLARKGARMMVNDLGLDAAEAVAAEIRAAGGQALALAGSVTDAEAVAALVERTLADWGRIDILVNNAGILRDRMLINMTEQEWDSVTNVHLKGTFAPTHHAANYWRQQSKEGKKVNARVINTSSHSGLFCNIGQANYAAAKAGIAAFSLVAARELHRYGITVNAIAPRATTRMTEGLGQWTPEQLERRDPEWIAALVTWLASGQSASVSGRVFEAWGFGYAVAESWQHGPRTEASKNPEELGPEILRIVGEARKNAGIDRDTWMDI